MLDKNKAIIEGAILVAQRTEAKAVILAATLPEERALLQGELGEIARVFTTHAGPPNAHREGEVLMLPEVRLRRRGRAKIALLEGLAALVGMLAAPNVLPAHACVCVTLLRLLLSRRLVLCIQLVRRPFTRRTGRSRTFSLARLERATGDSC